MPYNYEDKQLESIKDLELKLDRANLVNFKNKILLELGRGFINSKKIIPYILITGISFSSFAMLYSIPFFKDTKKQNLWTKKEIDSNGNIAVEEQYQKMNNPSEVSYISEWKLSSNGYYERNIVTYNIKALSEEEIERLVLENDVSLNEVLGDPIVSKIEKKNNVSEEELNTKGFIRAVIYNEVIDKYTYVEEPSNVNNQATILWLIINSTLNGIYALYAIGKGEEKINKQLINLEEKYEPLDIDLLKRKLEIRKDTYNRMR